VKRIVRSESDSEKCAREVVENRLGIQLEFSDLNGQVDYLALEPNSPAMALEVTSFADSDKWELSKVAHAQNYLIEKHYLNRNWLINVNGVPNFKKLERELIPRLVDLDIHDLSEVRASTQGWWLENVPTLQGLIKAIKSNNVEFISSWIGNFKGQLESDPRLAAIIYSENWMYGGVDSSLELVEKFIECNIQDRRKLRESSLLNRHIFIWVNQFSKTEVREVFDGAILTLPTRPPNLPEEVTHLWLADEVTKKTFYFDPVLGWEVIEI
jgi:hypothetical protein